MRYQITGKQIDIGTALQDHVETELDAVIEKYARRPTNAMVTFSRTGQEYACEAIVHLSTGLTVQAKGRAFDIYPAFDSACARMEKQLRRYKRRLKDHQKDRTQPVDAIGGSAYVLAASTDDEASEPDSLTPVIIAETETRIPSISVGEAVMQMELAEAPLLVFRNEGTDSVNVVYRREDGNVGWIEPGGS